ncbi:MAG: ATP-binding cassette domain-containing protein [Actinobacteria bacterium]|nr:ATP-binding cassette domain-containing protein [Actinomycetota bacterium]
MKIQIRDLFYLYSKKTETTVALRGLNMEIESGECLVINGPNGSGKSTLVKILTGFQEASAGQIYFGNEEIRSITPQNLRRFYVSSIDQKGNLIADLTILQFISLNRSLADVPMKEAKVWAEQKLIQYGLEHLSESYPSTLSLGERQICSLLAALANEPRILIADEPSGELDDNSSDQLYRALKQLAGKITLIIVTHDLRAEKIADRVVRLHKGRVSETWVPGGMETPVVDPFGWVRNPAPMRKLQRRRKFNYSGNAVLFDVEDLASTVGIRKLFSDITMSANSGELIVVQGDSGTGKSTFLRILAGLQTPAAGTVRFQGKDIFELSPRDRATLRLKSVGFLNQGDGALERTVLREHLEENAEAIHDFESRLNDPLSKFSGGERARIEITKLFTSKKPVLILDEPTSSLDEERAGEIFSMVFNYVEMGGLVITSTREEVLIKSSTQKIRL